MNKPILWLGGMLLAIALTAAANASVPTPLASAATVRIKDFAYDPPTVTVRAGDRVTFVNDDDEAHTVTATDKSFDSGGLDTAGTWQHAFAKPGTYHYYCELHPYMKGTVVVLPGPAN
jgi:plastocyanin